MVDINVKFTCKLGQELAASDAHHDFVEVNDTILRSTIPTCSDNKFTHASEEVELNNIIKYVMGDTFKNLKTTDLIMKRLVQGGLQESYSDSETEKIPDGLAYTAYNLRDLEYRSWMSSSSTKNKKVKAKFRKNNIQKKRPLIIEEVPITGILQKTIQENTGLDKVYIIDDIHSTAFTENIKIKPNPSQKEAFWCYLQTPQTIFDPAGKITPESKPGIFSSGNVEYGWYDIRPDKSIPIVKDAMNTIASEIINYPKLTTESGDEPVIYNREKLMLKNDVYLSIKGNPLDPYSHQVNFFSKIDEGNIFAVFDNRSSAIKNRNYMSTNIKGPINNALKSINTNNISKLKPNLGMKAHFVAKRFGDQGQANVTCNPIIPIIQKTDNDEYTATKTTGNHIFVSKDRLAIGAALLYNSPMILHLKAGSPKNNLHNILYIRNDLIKSSKDQQNNEIDKINKRIIALNDKTSKYSSLEFNNFKNQLREQLAKFKEIVENTVRITSVMDYIATVEANTAAFIQCKITENKLLSNTTPEKLTEISTIDDVKDKIDFRNMINEMETKIADITNIYSNITEIKTLIEKNVFDKNGTMYIDNSNTEESRTPITTKRRQKSAPTNISELRQIWKPVFDRIYMYETGNSEISNAFSTTCVALALPNGDQARLVGILEQYTAEIVRETAFEDLVKRGFATQTITITKEDEQAVVRKWINNGTNILNSKETGIIRDWINSRGNTLGGLLSERQFIDDFIDKNSEMAVPSWITELKRNKLGQFESSRLLDLQFARLVYAYFNPKIINYGLHVVDKLNSEFLEYYRNRNPREFTSRGFASDLYYGYDDPDTFNEDLENDVKYYTEMDYFNRAYKKIDPKSELLCISLEILWRSQNIKDSISKFEQNIKNSLFEGINESELKSELHIVADSDNNKDLDPVVQINNYAIDRLFTSSNDNQVDGEETWMINDDQADNDTSWMINDDASTRIIFKKNGIMKQSCGFYKNCIIPTLKDLNRKREGKMSEVDQN